MNTSIAVITGATSGVGREISRPGDSGLDGACWARDAERGEKAAVEIGGRTRVLDRPDPAGVAAAAAAVPKLDILVNNAAISLATGH
jgi:NADP-dependent 3-hydroxy acid dehydrogenase YdfG